MIVEVEEKSYIIKRSFGSTKKEDKCEVLDEITGDTINIIYSNEPGRDFLEINASTFSKTLFISQLGVKVDKDKEEEIMEKITNVYNCGEENVSVKKAIEILDKSKKQLLTSRKVGELDLLREKRDSLKELLWEGYKLAEANIENEEALLKNKENKIEIKKIIENLDLYKKYIKKINLQNDYKKIVQYLIKGEELRKKEEEISGELTKSNKFISEELLEEINKDYNRYLNLNDVKQDKLQELYKLEKKLQDKNENLKDFEVFKSIEDDNIKEKVYILKMEQENLKEKINDVRRAENDINKLTTNLNNLANRIGKIELISKYRENINEVTNSYKEKLKELKYKIEKDPINTKENSTKIIKNKILGIYIGTVLGTIFFLLGVIKRNIPIILILIGVFIVLIRFYLKYSLDLKNQETSEKIKKDIENLKKLVYEDEKKLSFYMKEINCNNCEELINKIKKYDSYKNYKEDITLSIKRRQAELNDINYINLKEKYNKNSNIVSSFLNVFKCNTLQEILEEIKIYEKLKKEFSPLEYQINILKAETENITNQLIENEEYLREKTLGLGFENIEIMDFHIKLKDYRDKLNKMQEIKHNLNSVEQTYNVLLKDRDINKIKEEMKDIITMKVQYSYQSEEEIDNEVKKKSDELINVEKKIKDLEHLIEKRYLGKKDISTIQEEIDIVDEKISKKEKEFNALDLASIKLQEAFLEVRKNISPKLNNTVIQNLNYLSSKNYKEAKISEDYKLKVRDNNYLFDAEILSNGAKDQLYLSLRLSFIEMLFDNKNIPIFLDDAFVQYDDKRREQALKLLIKEKFKQILIFTCQTIDINILNKNSIKYNLIKLS